MSDTASARPLYPEPTARRRGVAVVTGGSAGLGRAIVRELAGLRYDVAVVARESDGLHAAAREVELAGQRGLALAVDVADAAAVDAAAERVEHELGPIDVWVNDAMTSVFARFLEVEPDEFERATQVTYLGFVNGTRAALTPDGPARARATSCRSVRRWPSGASRCRAPTAAPSTPWWASPSRCRPSSTTTGPASRCRWSTCPR